jgi:multiple sugar transport system ATP-binding protein
MNFFRGAFVTEPLPQLQCAGGTLPLPGVPDAVRAHRDDRQLVVGVRPEHLHLAHPPHAGGGGGAQEACFTGTLETVEPVGNEIFLTVRSAIGPAICRIPPQSVPEIGQTLTLHFAGQRLRYFDALSGGRIR